MRVVIDMQGAQSSSRNRGIGRYSLALAKAIVRNRGDHEVVLALNGLFPDTIEPLRGIFGEWLPQDRIRVWHASAPVAALERQSDWRRNCAERIRQAFLARLYPDVVLVTSVFEGLGEDAVTSIGEVENRLPTVVILYDLIPLIYPQIYLDAKETNDWYQMKLAHLKRADRLLAISESCREDGIRYLGVQASTVINISAAAEPQFRPLQISAEREAAIRQRYGLRRPYAMYTGGIDHRKNFEGLISAYAKLPRAVRAEHQLAIVCSLHHLSRAQLEGLVIGQGLSLDDVVLTDYVPEEDLVALYNLCKAFVFPSWHEGFGLPALEAMCCGRAVIASNTSSLPEVIGRADALFDPYESAAIADKLEQVLSDDTFRSALERHGLERARSFTWDRCAARAIAALESLQADPPAGSRLSLQSADRPRLAYVSPLPPTRSGISDYSAELLPALARHYEIDVILAQQSTSDSWVQSNLPIRTVEWFRANADQFDRVLYHFGNSVFHENMFEMLDHQPGIVTLHDFHLSNLLAHLDDSGSQPGAWTDALFHSHGYGAVAARLKGQGQAGLSWQYPCNLAVLQGALGVIVHSEYPRRLADQWYGQGAGADWAVIPLLRVPAEAVDRAQARQTLELSEDAFVVCSFGGLGPHKLNRRLLDAWLASKLGREQGCILVFVGEVNEGEYGAELRAAIKHSPFGERIRIAGWVNATGYRTFLAAADVAVQLRTMSRGETSAAVLDCMNFGVPTVVNANGSQAELDERAVWKLPDSFEDVELKTALETLWRDIPLRRGLGARAREMTLAEHNPRRCASRYQEAIETIYATAGSGLPALIRDLAQLKPAPRGKNEWRQLAGALARTFPPEPRQRQLLVDVSELVERDARSGIQRVVRSILRELLEWSPAGFRVEPVYATRICGYRYARKFTLRFLGCPEGSRADEPIDFHAGDVFLGLDWAPEVWPAQRMFLQQMRHCGVEVWFVVYDMIPPQLPDAFPDGLVEAHLDSMNVVSQGDGLLCISAAVAEEVRNWMVDHSPERHRPLRVEHFHLGADIASSIPTVGLPENAQQVLARLQASPSFLMVGTLEPRKGHAQVLGAMEQLWRSGVDANLVIVGKEGWLMDELTKLMSRHRENGRRLFWLEGISDEFLLKVYETCTALVAASHAEGFGLPLIEAAQQKLPIIARDIPVFREVAGEHAYYFDSKEPSALADALSAWLHAYQQGKAPRSDSMPHLSWKQSTQELLRLILPVATPDKRTAAD